jgi:hypothetical protein
MGTLADESLTRQLAEQSQIYDQRFRETFTLPAEYSSPSYTKFAQSITSNLIGGIGYFYGDSIIDRSFKQPYDDDGSDDDDEDVYTGPKGPTMEPPRELLTATPSRSFFPRGFYWDEGFHLPIIADWDNDLSLEILKSWIDLIDENGWVAREQILGDEARSKVPSEFQTQYPSYANPPTLPMAVTGYISRLKKTEQRKAEGGAAVVLEAQLGLGQLPLQEPASSPALVTAHLDSPSLASAYLQSIYPSLRRHYQWFRRTQRGQLKEWGRKATSRVEAYRWRGRTEHHVLTSGLDDYPRAEKPHVGELHVDLMSWMGFFARTMREVAEYLGEEDDEVEYRRHERGILANLEGMSDLTNRLLRVVDGTLVCSQICTGAKTIRHTATSPLMTMVSIPVSFPVSALIRVFARRIRVCLPQGLHLALPAAATACQHHIATSRGHTRPDLLARSAVVRLRYQVLERFPSAIRSGRRLLARSDLDPDELVDVEGAQGKVCSGGRAIPGKSQGDLRQAEAQCSQECPQGMLNRTHRGHAHLLKPPCRRSSNGQDTSGSNTTPKQVKVAEVIPSPAGHPSSP